MTSATEGHAAWETHGGTPTDTLPCLDVIPLSDWIFTHFPAVHTRLVIESQNEALLTRARDVESNWVAIARF